MVWLIINGVPTLYGSEAEGLQMLGATLDDRRRRQCTVTPQDQPAFGIEYRVQYAGMSGFELINLTLDEPELPRNPEQD